MGGIGRGGNYKPCKYGLKYMEGMVGCTENDKRALSASDHHASIDATVIKSVTLE